MDAIDVERRPDHGLIVEPIDAAAFAAFGQLIEAGEDGVPFGSQDAQLDLSKGTPRFYIMALEGRPFVLHHVTRHRQVTQCLASVGGRSWFLAVAPSTRDDVDPASIKAFAIPGDVAIMLERGTWHAGPLFVGDHASFFNLELADTNVVDHEDFVFDHPIRVVTADASW